MSASSYYDVHHEGGPLGGQQLQYAGEPKLRLEKHGGTYVRETLRGDGDEPLRQYRYRWEADDTDGNARVPVDGDDASAMLERGPIEIPDGSSIAVGASGEVDSDDETADKQQTVAAKQADAKGSKTSSAKATSSGR